MSRLTSALKNGKIFVPHSNCDGLQRAIEKLAAYEDIGEPEELVKPVRCGECKHAEPRED